ncbi:MAG: sec-independent protein translocase protein TatC [Planctomycetota bacterium]|jgi:sec-independent protein translocase protein TatC
MVDDLENTRMTLGEHLAELRTRLVKGVVGVAIAFCFAWWQYERISEIVMAPFHKAVTMINVYFADHFAKKVAAGDAQALDYFTTEDPKTWELLAEFESADKLSVFAPAEGFTYILRICLYFALFLGGPFLLWQMWQFLAAGLYKKERKAALRYFPFSAILFVTGVLFGYYLMVPYGMYYLGIALDTDVLNSQYRLSDYFSLLTALSLALAVVFQLPVMMTFATRLGLLEPKQLSGSRPYVIVGAFVLSAILTPPDPVTQCMMAIPIVLLFEVGLISARMCAKPRMIDPEEPA